MNVLARCVIQIQPEVEHDTEHVTQFVYTSELRNLVNQLIISP